MEYGSSFSLFLIGRTFPELVQIEENENDWADPEI